MADAQPGDRVKLRPVAEIAFQAQTMVAGVSAELTALLPGSTIEHIGATSLPDGVTRGDVDLNIRVPASDFIRTVEALSSRFTVAQPKNWTSTFASYSDGRHALPLGLQVTVIDAPEDFLVRLRDLMRDDAAVRDDYQRCKTQAAVLGASGYWEAKNRMLQGLLGRGRRGLKGSPRVAGKD